MLLKCYSITVEFRNIPHEDKVYWSDTLQGMILSAFSNSTFMKILFSFDVISQLGMVIDKVGINLYWTDLGTKRIEVGRRSSANIIVFRRGNKYSDVLLDLS